MPRTWPRSGLAHGDRVDGPGGPWRALLGQTAVAYPIAKGSVAAYYPRANNLIALDDCDRKERHAAYNSVPVTIRAAL